MQSDDFCRKIGGRQEDDLVRSRSPGQLLVGGWA